MVSNKYKLEKQREEVLSKVGRLGMFFGSGENARTNYVGFTIIVLLMLTGVAVCMGATDLFHALLPVLTFALGYFIKDK